MGDVTQMPGPREQNWLAIERRIRPDIERLADTPEEVDWLLARQKNAYERCTRTFGAALCPACGPKVAAEIIEPLREAVGNLMIEILRRDIAIFKVGQLADWARNDFLKETNP